MTKNIDTVGASHSSSDQDRLTLKTKAYDVLHENLKTQAAFIKVHAAEYLIWLGAATMPHAIFLEENKLHGTEPKYRIGIWRVLAESSKDTAEKNTWGQKVLAAFADLQGPDRLHASETLAKLKISPLESAPEACKVALADTNRNLQLYTSWAMSYSPHANKEQYKQSLIQTLLNDPNEIARVIAAYILKMNFSLNESAWTSIAEFALTVPLASTYNTHFWSVPYLTCPASRQGSALYLQILERLTGHMDDLSADQRIVLAQSLAIKGNGSQLPLLQHLLDNPPNNHSYDLRSPEGADVQSAAAYAILRIMERKD